MPNSLPQPNRMIKLFQTKADTAYAKYLKERSKDRNGQDKLQELLLTKLLTEFETWHKAADLMRKEELTRVKDSGWNLPAV